MYVDHKGRRIWNPLRKIRARIKETERYLSASINDIDTNLAKRQQTIVQVVEKELHSHRESLTVQLEEIRRTQRIIAKNLAELTKTFQTLTSSTEDVHRDNLNRAAENYGRDLEDYAGLVVEGGLPKPPPGLTGRG